MVVSTMSALGQKVIESRFPLYPR